MVRQLGVEEELLLVDAESLAPVAMAGSLLRFAAAEGVALTAELQQQQIEVDTAPTRDLTELADALRAERRTAAPARRSNDRWPGRAGTWRRWSARPSGVRLSGRVVSVLRTPAGPGGHRLSHCAYEWQRERGGPPPPPRC